MTETTPSLPASGQGEVAGLVEELRAGLEGVPKGPWFAYMNRYEVRTDATFIGDQEIVAMCATGRNAGKRAAHIARCSPDNIAKLLDHIDALTAQLAAPTPSPVEARADGVRVKALRWINSPRLGGGEKLIALDCFGNEFARLDYINVRPEAVAEFKRRKQADYEARIFAALESTPTPSPVEARADGLPLKRWQRVVNRGAAMIEALADGQLTLAETGTAASVMRELREVEASILAALESTPAQPVREDEGVGRYFHEPAERGRLCVIRYVAPHYTGNGEIVARNVELELAKKIVGLLNASSAEVCS